MRLTFLPPRAIETIKSFSNSVVSVGSIIYANFSIFVNKSNVEMEFMDKQDFVMTSAEKSMLCQIRQLIAAPNLPSPNSFEILCLIKNERSMLCRRIC